MKLGAESQEVTIEESTGRTVIQAEVYAYHSENIALHKLRLGADIDLETYIKARLKLDQFRRGTPKTFAGVDVLVTPTTPVPPPKASELPSKFDDIMSNDAVMFRKAFCGARTISVEVPSLAAQGC